MNRIIPLKIALAWIFLSLFIISGSGAAGLYYYKSIKRQKESDPRYNISLISQRCLNSPEPLDNGCLAELLELSVDRPANLYRFNVQEGKDRLLKHPLIKRAEIKKNKPCGLFIDYSMRLPIAFLGDLKNGAIDDEGTVIPYSPYFLKRKLPLVFAGNLDDAKWGEPLPLPKSELVLGVFQTLARYSRCGKGVVRLIDISKAFALSYGQRQIVVAIKHGDGAVRWLRLSTKYYRQELAGYFSMAPHITLEKYGKSVLIELRVPNLAFVREVKD